MTGRRGKTRQQLVDDLKEKRRYCRLVEETLGGHLWRCRFGRVNGPVVRLRFELMNI